MTNHPPITSHSHTSVLLRPHNCLHMEIRQNGPNMLPMSAKDLVIKEKDRYMEPPDFEEHFDVDIMCKEMRNNKIFPEILTNKVTPKSSLTVEMKNPTKEEKVRKWSLSGIYRKLRTWLREHLDNGDQQVDGFEQMFYTGEN